MKTQPKDYKNKSMQRLNKKKIVIDKTQINSIYLMRYEHLRRFYQSRRYGR